ncbi:hypothetical protein QC823_01135 [Halomonas vilamensis]|uniref:Uncharacterized protein n=1 Tax=Vreelandella vilamensis TaxID=531309 RepID=A0ABU1GZX2_9GAMM|nr:hypothetical protein [Halomonas vilamensis]MDR5897599.1 hypothetical protein [Halomonas vilamensis]
MTIRDTEHTHGLPLWPRALKTALVVGPLLTIINQCEALWQLTGH